MKRIIFLISILIFSNSVQGRLRAKYEDATIVERSELIVIGQIKEGSIEYSPHINRDGRIVSREYHVILKITEIFKGQSEEKEIPIIIHYGLTPVVGGYEKRDNFMINRRGGRTDYPKDIIEIFDTGNSELTLTPLTSDSRKDNLWFLRKLPSETVKKPDELMYGIRDPEDHQSIEWKDYFLAYMSDDPETSVKEWAAKNPEKASRAQNYFDHLEVQRILKIENTQERIEKLMPYFLKRIRWNMDDEVKSGIISCGKVAGDYLLKSFDEPEYKNMRQTIILMWRDMKYKDCIPFLIKLLKKHDQFWSEQKLEKGWWNKNFSSELTNQQRTIYGEVYYGICTLSSFNDPQTREIIELTKKRWKELNFDNPQIVEECEAALKKIEEHENNR